MCATDQHALEVTFRGRDREEGQAGEPRRAHRRARRRGDRRGHRESEESRPQGEQAGKEAGRQDARHREGRAPEEEGAGHGQEDRRQEARRTQGERDEEEDDSEEEGLGDGGYDEEVRPEALSLSVRATAGPAAGAPPRER